MVSSPVPVDANQPHVVGVLVSADQQTLPVERQQLRLHANGILRAAHATQEAHLSVPGVDRGELEGAVLGQQRAERRQAVTVGQDVALRLGLLQVHRRLASGDVDPEHVDELGCRFILRVGEELLDVDQLVQGASSRYRGHPGANQGRTASYVDGVLHVEHTDGGLRPVDGPPYESDATSCRRGTVNPICLISAVGECGSWSWGAATSRTALSSGSGCASQHGRDDLGLPRGLQTPPDRAAHPGSLMAKAGTPDARQELRPERAKHEARRSP